MDITISFYCPHRRKVLLGRTDLWDISLNLSWYSWVQLEPMTEESTKGVAIPSCHQTINPFYVNLTFQFQPKLRPVSSSIKVWIVDTSLVTHWNFSRLLTLGKNNQIFYTLMVKFMKPVGFVLKFTYPKSPFDIHETDAIDYHRSSWPPPKRSTVKSSSFITGEFGGEQSY